MLARVKKNIIILNEIGAFTLESNV